VSVKYEHIRREKKEAWAAPFTRTTLPCLNNLRGLFTGAPSAEEARFGAVVGNTEKTAWAHVVPIRGKSAAPEIEPEGKKPGADEACTKGQI